MKVRVPGSKSYTNRALLLGALCEKDFTVHNPLYSDDTEAMIEALELLGIEVERHVTQSIVRGSYLAVESKKREFFARDSGTTARFLLPLLCICPGEKIVRGSPSLSKRPMQDLVKALESLGCHLSCIGEEGHLPISILSSSFSKNLVEVRGDTSSQFLSALLLVAPVSQGMTISLSSPLVSAPYVEMTIDAMKKCGARVDGNFSVSGGGYTATSFVVEPDFSSAAYFFALALLEKRTICVEGVSRGSLQADRRILAILEAMGGEVTYCTDGIAVRGKELRPVFVSMEDCPDQIPTIAVLAAFAKGTTEIWGIETLRWKECDRVAAIESQLQKMGIQTLSTKNSLRIMGGSPTAARIDPHGDHRLAMSFGIAKGRVPDLVIEDPHVVGKTFPTFWEVLSQVFS